MHAVREDRVDAGQVVEVELTFQSGEGEWAGGSGQLHVQRHAVTPIPEGTRSSFEF